MRQHLLSHLDDLLPVAMIRRAHAATKTALAARLVMKTDVVEHDDDYTVTAELPGFDKDAITVTYAEHWLTIQAVAKTGLANRDDDGRVLRHERSNQALTRRFYFKDVVRQAIQAHYQGGLLTVTLPKKASTVTNRIDVQ